MEMRQPSPVRRRRKRTAKWTAKLATGAAAPVRDDSVLVVEIPEDRDWMAEFPPERLPHKGLLSGVTVVAPAPFVPAPAPRVTAPAPVSSRQGPSVVSPRLPGQQDGPSLSINVTTFRKVHRSIVLTITVMALTLSIGVVTIGLWARGPAAPAVATNATPPAAVTAPEPMPTPSSTLGQTSALASPPPSTTTKGSAPATATAPAFAPELPPLSTGTPARASTTPADQPREMNTSAASALSAAAVTATPQPREVVFSPPPLPTGAGLPEMRGIVMPQAPPLSKPAPPPAAVPAPPPAAAPAVAATAAAKSANSPSARETSAILSVLDRYRRAFSSLNAQSVRAVWPGANLRALTREFSDLKRQTLAFDHCRVDVQGSRADATCGGRASVVPKSGNTANIESRRWVFTLVNRKDSWRIETVDSQ